MSHAHSFFISNIEYLIDIESFLKYLSTVISEFHECLFCGSEKPNKIAVQDHMRAKGHCKLDSEDAVLGLKDFYDLAVGEDQCEYAADLRSVEMGCIIEDGTELHLPSGKILGHRSQPQNRPSNRSCRAPSTSQSLLAENGSQLHTPSVSNSSNQRRNVARPGTSVSIIEVSKHQQRALIAAERRIDRSEGKVRNLYEAKVEKGGNKQKTFRAVGIGKKAGGLEKRNG
ncbi:hypothetical protein QTJ16_006609 [Diplocarpon rosae]|uniref:ZN622/Rei1/Reh1 zinc finger C2H2-type domain-containing protein n=1 Tax=Diplocarpon rosae TaxID=946125 RepID=A0AAD9SWH3_9HELO|nr:hypothetical protein QTJ16_006609 [Diplocarpon rosae]